MSDNDQSQTLAGTRMGRPPATGRDDAPPPQVLGGRYRLHERIADGGMASVWRATDEILDRTVAVKLLHDHLAADEAFRERFRREAIAAARLTHPNVVGLYDTGADDNRVWLIMEYVKGSTLRDVIARQRTLDPAQAAAIGEKVARALDYAHRKGLVHRDVKPGNILLGDDGAVKVADFGIAKAEEADDLTRTGMVLGTAAYVAPEQIRAEAVDGKTDQYSLGVVLYEALTGRQPFKGDSPVATAAQRLDSEPLPPRAVRADIPRPLDQAILRAMARRPQDRYPTAGGFADALTGQAADDPEHTAMLAAAASSHSTTTALPHADTGELGSTPDAPARDRPPRRRVGLVVLGLLLLTVAAASAMLALPQLSQLIPTRGEGDDGGGEAAAENTEESAPTPRVRVLETTGADDFDPQGDDQQENPEDVEAVIDGDPASSWRTELYNSPALGGLKEGVGIIVELGDPARVRTVTVFTNTPGIDYEVRVARRPRNDLEDYRVVGRVDGAGAREVVRLDTAVRARAVLIWITGDLQPLAGRYAAELSAIEVRGTPA